jgi:hypothetical protein
MTAQCLDRMRVNAGLKQAGALEIDTPSSTMHRSADKGKSLAALTLRGVSRAAGGWFGVASQDNMEDARAAFVMRKTLGKNMAEKEPLLGEPDIGM